MPDLSIQIWVPPTPVPVKFPAIRLRVNGRAAVFRGDPTTPVLWYLRDHAGLTGTKFGCGVGVCGACTVHLDGSATRSCTLRMGDVATRQLTTIEGLADGAALHAVQQAWIDAAVSECGYCQAGQIMTAVSLLRRNPSPSDADIDGISNLCRCGSYSRVRVAIRRAAAALAKAPA
jgi:isoquinoline 1-oxidoreductase alpha subunit